MGHPPRQRALQAWAEETFPKLKTKTAVQLWFDEVRTEADLLSLDDKEILALKGIGPVALAEIRAAYPPEKPPEAPRDQ